MTPNRQPVPPFPSKAPVTATLDALVSILERLETSLVEGHPTQDTRICGHDGCLVGVLESCPACLVRFELPIEAGRFAHLTTTPGATHA